MDQPVDKTAIRHAATVILVRDPEHSPKVLMGQRGASAAFMPNKFVFPGGAVDAEDAQVPLAETFADRCAAQLAQNADAALVPALAGAAVRELWEETGLVLGQPGEWRDPPAGWRSFAQTGHIPSAGGLSFVFRAITPPGRPRRFDARFFLADAARVVGDPDDFTHATDELRHLQWIPLDEVRGFALPFITEVVLAEVEARLPDMNPPETVPFFKNDDEESLFLRLAGQAR
ncbi:MAG: NUDIX hydrolase [Rhodobacteraceae bacterium]|nr:NUDIX hydrolase [Paracoccaceae bacterium]